MLVYVDSSAALRVALGAPNRLREWGSITRGVSSRLLGLECLRFVDRERLRLGLDDAGFVDRREAIYRILGDIEIIPVTDQVLERASQPFPSSLGSLDSIHLASALLWQQSEGESLSFATHDGELSQAARAMGFKVLG